MCSSTAEQYPVCVRPDAPVTDSTRLGVVIVTLLRESPCRPSRCVLFFQFEVRSGRFSILGANVLRTTLRLGIQEMDLSSATEDEQVQELMRQFRETGTVARFSETTFRRFLVGRKRDLSAALRDLVAFAKWREEHRAEVLTLDDGGDYARRRVTFFHDRDRMNRPILVSIIGRHLGGHRDIEEVRRFIIYLLEKAVALAAPEEKILSVFDLTAFSLRNMDLESVSVFLGTLQAYYPEILGQLLVVNAPFVFWACWAVIRPLIDPNTPRRLSLSVSMRWRTILRESIFRRKSVLPPLSLKIM